MADLNKEEMSKYNQKLILQIIKLFPNSPKIKVTFENNRITVHCYNKIIVEGWDIDIE